MKSKQSAAVEALLKRAKALRALVEGDELQRKRRQNSKKYKLPRVVKAVLRPKKAVIAGTTCYFVGKGQRCVLYFHGGSYVDPPLVFHWRFLQQLTRETGVSALLPLYGRAPQHQCENTVVHVKNVYMKVAERCGVNNLIVMGDSAGGGLALALCEYLARHNLPQPQKLILFSPWVDVDMTGDYSAQSNDLALDEDLLRLFGRAYRGDLPKRHYMASPLFGVTQKLAPMHVFVGDAELFYPDCLALQRAAEKAGAQMTLYVYPEMQHVFLLYPIPEAKTARRQAEEILLQ